MGEQLVEIEASAVTATPSPEDMPDMSTLPVSQSVSSASPQAPRLPQAPTLPGLETVPANAFDEAQLLSEQARAMFEHEDDAAVWLDDYYSLQAEGWSWRQAVYIIWASQPKAERVPSSEKALAVEVLGLTSARAIRLWKQENPQLELRIRKQQLAELGRNRSEVLKALVDSAAKPDYRNYRDRELFLKMTGDYKPTERVEVGTVTEEQLGAMSTDELAALARVPVDGAAARSDAEITGEDDA